MKQRLRLEPRPPGESTHTLISTSWRFGIAPVSSWACKADGMVSMWDLRATLAMHDWVSARSDTVPTGVHNLTGRLVS